MPELVQFTSLDLYSEQGYKEGYIEIGESIMIEESKYALTVMLMIPETSVNINISGVNVEVWADETKIGKGYKNIKKFEGFAGNFKKGIWNVGVIAGISDDAQVVKVTIPLKFDDDVGILKIRVFPEELQIQEASTRFDAKLTGIKYVLNQYSLTSCAIGVSWIVIVQLTIGCFIKNSGKF